MAQSDFDAAILDVESGTSQALDADLATFYADFLTAVNTRIGTNNPVSPASQKLRAIRTRVQERVNEANPRGPGLVLPQSA